MSYDEMEKMVAGMPTGDIRILSYYIDCTITKRLCSWVKKLAPDTMEADIPCPITDVKRYAKDMIAAHADGIGTISVKKHEIVKVRVQVGINDDDMKPYGVEDDGTSIYLGCSSLLGTSMEIISQFEDIEYAKQLEERYTGMKAHFENEDIIITDPCYVVKNDDWDKCQYGKQLEAIGLTNCISRDTIYGDWSCTVYNSDTRDVMGEFCADAGMVAVFSLNDILAYNPDFDYHVTKTWTTALIKNFTGDVWFEKKKVSGIYDDDTKYHKKGDNWHEDYLEVVGKGNINFVTKQTGL